MRGQQVAASRDRPDRHLVVVGERLAQLADGLRRESSVTKTPGQTAAKVGLADHPAAIGGQVFEQRECFRPQRNRLVIAQQQAARPVKLAVAERQNLF